MPLSSKALSRDNAVVDFAENPESSECCPCGPAVEQDFQSD